jgi:hypothetical protein
MCQPLPNLPTHRYYSGWRYGCDDPQKSRPKQWWAERDGQRLAATSETLIKQEIDELYERLTEPV